MKVLLHICCAVCAGAVIEKLKQDDNKVIAFFYNPNIFPEEEYARRQVEAMRVCKELGVEFIEGENDHACHAEATPKAGQRRGGWLEKVKEYAAEREGGKRCEICFAIRLSEASQKAKEIGCDAIATTLTISPHKNTEVVNRVGKECSEIYGLEFIDTIWRKAGGFKRACEIAKEKNVYHQNYCGCEFSRDKMVEYD